MKRVLLVTLQGNFNYGNRLQNYALQRAMEQLGFRVDSLTARKGAIKIPGMTKKLWNRKLRYYLGQKEFGASYSRLRRDAACLRFSDKRIHRVYFPYEEIMQKDWSAYDCAVTGSDQVWHNWHSDYLGDELAFYYLAFMAPEKRISYAPSFGFSRFPEEDLEKHREGLAGMKALSCRETEGCRMIRELTGREAEKVLDPVLLLPRAAWEKLERKPRRIGEAPYLLLFFLGEVPEEYKKEIERIRARFGAQILNLNDPSDVDHYGASPEEFLWLIHHAQAVCTDSFHTSAFSVLFGTRLRVFPRKQQQYEDMFGRLHDLLSPLGLMHLAYGQSDGAELSTALSPEAAGVLENEREKSLAYLRRSLGAE